MKDARSRGTVSIWLWRQRSRLECWSLDTGNTKTSGRGRTVRLEASEYCGQGSTLCLRCVEVGSKESEWVTGHGRQFEVAGAALWPGGGRCKQVGAFFADQQSCDGP